MKILMLNYECPPLGGGAGRISYNIAYNISLKNNEVVFLTTWFKNLREIEIVNNNFKIIRLKSQRKHLYKSNAFEMLCWIIKCFDFILKNKSLIKTFDYCLANFAIPGGIIAYYLKKKYKIPFSVISHGHDIPWYYKKQMFFYHLLLYWIIKLICLRCDKLFVQSQYMYKNAVNFLGQKNSIKIKIIYNGVSYPINFNYEHRKTQPFTILFVGRLVKQKRPDVFINALVVLRYMQIQYHAYIIGDGPLCKKLRKMLTKYNLNHIKMVGWISNSEIWKYYERAHVLVLPSESEGMSIAVLEAKVAGLYIITTNVSGNLEILNEYKFSSIINELSYKKIADELQAYYFNYYLKKLFPDENYCKTQSEKFLWGPITEKYLNEIMI
ncbi:MAG: glycosyltransferase family 4 protein [Bacteroidales bacterium]|nr:glycosyltransferase family 4 protein [Bacteroidales bacterium]